MSRMMSVSRHACLGLLLWPLLVACYASVPASPPIQQEDKGSHALDVADSRSPMSLEVLEDYNDGNRLFVRARMKAETTWPLSDIAVRFTGLSEGEEKVSTTTKLSELLHDVGNVHSGESRDLLLNLSAKGISDYQLELLWGQGTTVETPQEKSVLAIQVQDLSTQRQRSDCVGSECSEKLKLVGTLVNQGATIAARVTLGVGLVWVPSNSKNSPKLDLFEGIPQDPGSEERVEIEGLNLSPGMRQAFTLDIARSVPQKEGGRYEPRVRVINE